MATNESTLNTLQNYSFAPGIISAIGSMAVGYYNTRAQNKIAKWQAVIAEQNKAMADLAAEDALIQSQYRIGQISMQAQALKSSQRASMAANGIVLGSGSAAELLTSTDILEKESIAVERMNGYRQAWGLRTQGVNYAGQAIAAKSSMSSPLVSGASGLMSGIADTAGDYVNRGLLKSLLGK